MKTYLSFILLAIVFTAGAQTIPYNLVPDWESNPNGHYATGLGLADINGDGWKDMVVANGNDMQRQRLVVYYNNGDGTFPPDPDWQSFDIDYHGHLAVGDIDKDGDMDVAVSVYIGPDGFSDPGKVKVYYNQGSELEPVPSFESQPFYTFSCALGDADGDGDLDLAVAAGEPYGQIYDQGKIFYNEGGVFQTVPDWESDIVMGAMDVEFGDIDLNGFLDIVFVCEYTDNYIYLADSNGNITTSPSWNSLETSNFMNSVDVGYWNEPREPIVVMTENDQLGGDGLVRMYDFGDGVPASSLADWYSDPIGYGSGILLADVTVDGIPDLIYGGWWRHVYICIGDGTSFETPAAYVSNSSSVVEAIQMADLDKELIIPQTDTIIVSSEKDGTSLILLEKQLTEDIITIKKNGSSLTPDQYTRVPNKNWLSFTDPLLSGDLIVIEYEYSPHPDMVISNWDSGKGNFIFYNLNQPYGLDEPFTDASIKVYPNPVSDLLSIELELLKSSKIVITLSDLAGRSWFLKNYFLQNGYHSISIDLSGLKAGLYILQLKIDGRWISKKIVSRGSL